MKTSSEDEASLKFFRVWLMLGEKLWEGGESEMIFMMQERNEKIALKHEEGKFVEIVSAL